jgi:flavin-dependent dehydrogenase
MREIEVAILGAGPSGSLAAALLKQRGLTPVVYERETFPRFSIGESLLPQTMGLMEEAGLLRAIVEGGFQFKNGAAFRRGERFTDFDFRDKHGDGWGTTYQVQRADFDQRLIDAVAAKGVEVNYRHEMTNAAFDANGAVLDIKGPEGAFQVRAKFVLDASGFGRILPKLLKLETPSKFPTRMAYFTHVQDNVPVGGMDRNKILVSVHPEHVDIWYWLIPFSNGRCSLGVVGEPAKLESLPGDESERLKAWHAQAPWLQDLLKHAAWDTPARILRGYSANVTTLFGPQWALLGNAGEFLDPVFSSGVTIAMKSASLAAPLVEATLKGQKADWANAYEKTLRDGVDAFRSFVESWYRGGFQDVIFYKDAQPEVRRYICAILAGYAWDRTNPYVAEPRRLAVLEEICRSAV